MQYRAILIGEKVETMRRLAQGMSRMGVSAHLAENTVSVMKDFAPVQVDAIVLGRLLSKRECDAIVCHWRALKPNILFVRVKRPIGELIAETVRSAAFKASGYVPIVASSSAYRCTISFSTMTTSNIEVILYHHTFMNRTRIQRIYAEQAVLSGQQIINIPRNALGYGGERFAVITINGIEKHIVPMH